MRRARVGLAAVMSGSLLLTACTAWLGPARTDEDFARKAGTTAKSVRSAVEVARLAADAAGKGNAFASYTTVLLSEAEDDAAGAESTFDKIQPPNDKADQQREQLDDLLNEATSILSQLRIEARRGHLDQLADIAQPLAGLSDKLQQFDESLPK